MAAQWLAAKLAGGHVPESNERVEVGSGDRLAVGTEGHAGHLSAAALQREIGLAGIRLPQTDGPIDRSGGNGPSVGAPRDTPDRDLVPRRAIPQGPAGGGIPQP